MKYPKPTPAFKINVDVTNPGQFFACCGLLELADRLWEGGAQGWFEEYEFCVAGEGTLSYLIDNVTNISLVKLDIEDVTASPIHLDAPFNLRLDWWHDTVSGGKDLKVWAGTMESHGIALAMKQAMLDERFKTASMLDIGMVVYDTEDTSKKKEPFYFDARRGLNAHTRDIGFSPNSLGLETTAYPAVEFLCLVGLQRVIPLRQGKTRINHYTTWSTPLYPELLPGVVTGLITLPSTQRYQFENWYRTGQKKHKAFLPATPVEKEIYSHD